MWALTTDCQQARNRRPARRVQPSVFALQRVWAGCQYGWWLCCWQVPGTPLGPAKGSLAGEFPQDNLREVWRLDSYPGKSFAFFVVSNTGPHRLVSRGIGASTEMQLVQLRQRDHWVESAGWLSPGAEGFALGRRNRGRFHRSWLLPTRSGGLGSGSGRQRGSIIVPAWWKCFCPAGGYGFRHSLKFGRNWCRQFRPPIYRVIEDAFGTDLISVPVGSSGGRIR